MFWLSTREALVFPQNHQGLVSHRCIFHDCLD
jgi:hypothetical protein